MSLTPQDALIYLMVVAASSDAQMSERELGRIEAMIARLPVFRGYDPAQLPTVANACVDTINRSASIEDVLDIAIDALPKRLHDTAYALTVEIVALDLDLSQEELRFLEMVRDRLDLDRLVTAAIEAAARARLRRA
jgi:hypothetical protein